MQIKPLTEGPVECDEDERHRRRLHGRARCITLDLDPTDDPTHGAQPLTFFNSHYDTWCYWPVVGFLSFNDEKEQYLCTAVLRPGDAVASAGAIGILWRILVRVERALPKARLRVRLDGGFVDPLVLTFLDAMGVEYVVAMAKNAVLNRLAEPPMQEARRLSEESGETEHVYGEDRYAAQSWLSARRAIFKAEVVRQPGKEPKDSPRFVITNLKQNPQWIYEQVYCERGDIENRIKELHQGLEIDRTSCSKFWANQFGVLMTAAAYVLMQELRLRAARTDCARAVAQTGSPRRCLRAPGGNSSSRLVPVPRQLPPDYPEFRRLERIARRLLPEYVCDRFFLLRTVAAKVWCLRNPPTSCLGSACNRNKVPEGIGCTPETPRTPRETP